MAFVRAPLVVTRLQFYTVKMKTRPTVTVLMSTFNRAQYLSESLASILGQTEKPLQIIVVNDGSTDSTREVLGSFSDSIHVIEKENSGKPASLNEALCLAKGDYVWIFDDDDVAISTSLEKMLDFICSCDVRPGFIYGSFLEGESDSLGKIKVLGEKKCPVYNSKEIFFQLLKTNYFSNLAMLIKRDALVSLQGFDETLTRSQDYDLNLRLAREFSGSGMPDAIFIRRNHAGVRGRQGAQFASGKKNLIWNQYDRMIVGKILPTVTDDELNSGLGDKVPAQVISRALNVARFSLLSRRGLWSDSYCFLANALRAAKLGDASEVERQLFIEAFNRNSFLLEKKDFFSIVRVLIMCVFYPSYFGINFARSVIYSYFPK